EQDRARAGGSGIKAFIVDRPPSSNATRTEPAVHRAWSVFIGRVLGIPIFLHFTFLIFLTWVALGDVFGGNKRFGGLLMVLAVFASVALHELGHALMALRFGIKTEDIVLYPIGGVARLRSMGEGWQEFWIALAGPAVNVVICVAIYALLYFSGDWVP